MSRRHSLEAGVRENNNAEDVEDRTLDVELGTCKGGVPVLAKFVMIACSID